MVSQRLGTILRGSEAKICHVSTSRSGDSNTEKTCREDMSPDLKEVRNMTHEKCTVEPPQIQKIL